MDQLEQRHGYRAPPAHTSWGNDRSVYILSAGGFVKIGVARDVAKRAVSLRAGCPFLIHIAAERQVPGVLAFQIERRLHTRLSAHRAASEWFQIEVDAALTLLDQEVALANTAIGSWRRQISRARHSTLPALGDRLRQLDADSSPA